MIFSLQWQRAAACLCAAASIVLMTLPAQAQEGLGALTSVQFDVRYMRGMPEADAQKTLDFMIASYKEIQAQTGLEPKKKLEVRMYDNVGRYLQETGLKKPWRGAFYTRGVIHCQPVAALTARNIFESSLKYELARAMLETSGQRGCPLWLREAYAVYTAGAYRAYTAPLGAKLTAFSDLNQDIQTYPDPPQREDVHYMLGTTMNFFVQKYGEKRAFGLFRQFDGMTGLESVFKRTLGDDLTAVEKAWAKFISYHTTPFKR
jgi:hypothetical protein